MTEIKKLFGEPCGHEDAFRVSNKDITAGVPRISSSRATWRNLST